MNFQVGQRWASHAETQLGLGIISHIDGRLVHISFPASGETRVYASHTAPLTRINYGVGDTVQNMEDESFIIEAVKEQDGIFHYQVRDPEGIAGELDEIDLSCFIRFTSPQQRLFNGQVDKNKHFNLRVQTLDLKAKQQSSPVKGLIGNRTELLPHQIYIAHEVAKRHAPRVLLADEVGLGKTIEAGMILHYQLQSGQAERVLILLPDSLVHQWLVEMRRRFNLNFSIYDKDRLEANSEAGFDNPFEAEQLVLCPLSLLTENETVRSFASASPWDIVVVDEAHHLEWSESGASDDYLTVEALAQRSAGLLLLTATPEQVGIEGHFARLRLLDPARFPDLESFRREQQNYQSLNEVVTALQAGDTSAEHISQLKELVDNETLAKGGTDQIINELLDRHGTGRVFFRNTRAAIPHFPQRQPLAHPLPMPEAYEEFALSLEHEDGIGLYPEQKLDSGQWLAADPRVEWLVSTLKSLKQQKVLVICHHANTALALDDYLNRKAGIRSTSFYEGLSIIERDRAAAYFAEGAQLDDEDDGWGSTIGAQVLVCSEIGSEGRNFQFAHHLVLFDLPDNPDLLEQRIGRLDRIGQRQDVNIHIPYLQGSAGEALFHFYDQGMNLFRRSCSVAYNLYRRFADELEPFLEGDSSVDDKAFQSLLDECYQATEASLAEMQNGRDKLIELNSCRHDEAGSLIDSIRENENSESLAAWMETALDHFNMESDYHSEGSLIIHATDRTTVSLPGLKDEGNTITFRREKAVVREDMDFLSWEHPMVTEAVESIVGNETGNTALATISVKGLPQGALLLEAIYTVDSIADKYLQLERYLGLNPTRFVINQQHKNFAKALPHDKLSSLCKPMSAKIIPAVIAQTKPVVQGILEFADQQASDQVKVLREQARDKLQASLGEELKRLQALKAVNPSIRESELEYLEGKIALCEEHIDRAELRLNALRIIINQPK